MDSKEKNNKEWYALYVNARHEKSIMLKLQEKGMEAYAPIIKRMSQWSDRKKLVEVPVISGYIFVRLMKEEMDRPRYIPGVVNYVRFQGKPAVIRPSEIEGLKYFISHGYSLEEAGNEELRIGDHVSFNLSDFKSFAGLVENLVGDQYAIVTFVGVERNFRLKVAVKALRKKAKRPEL